MQSILNCVLLFADHGAELVCNGIVREHSPISKVVETIIIAANRDRLIETGRAKTIAMPENEASIFA